MNGRGAIVTAVAAIALSVASPAWAGAGPAGFTSDNVEHLRNIPDHADSSGARLLGKHFYISTSRDLTIYDVSTPEQPQLAGRVLLPRPGEPTLPEEDVDTNGRIALIENLGTLFVIDVSDKTRPVVLSELSGAGVHTITCVLDCTWAYGNNGRIFDLRDPRTPKLVATRWTNLYPVESTHDVTEVAPGIILTASQPMRLLDARMDPANPRLLATTPRQAGRFIHATRWPNGGQDDFFLAGGEATGPGCAEDPSAQFSTWDARGWTDGVPAKQIDEYRVVPSSPEQGSNAESSWCTHWFDEHPNYKNGGPVAISWYEHGTRFLRVSRKGKISEEGWHVPNGGQASAAYWITDRIVYVADYLRGLDVLRFNGDVSGAEPKGGAATDGGSSGSTTQGSSGSTSTQGPAAAPGPALGQTPRRAARRVSLSSFLSLPSIRRCVGRRGLRLRPRRGVPARLTDVMVRVNGRRTARFRGHRARRSMRVRLPNRPFLAVHVAARTANGKRYVGRASYRRCGARRSSARLAATLPRGRGMTRYGALCYLRGTQPAR